MLCNFCARFLCIFGASWPFSTLLRVAQGDIGHSARRATILPLCAPPDRPSCTEGAAERARGAQKECTGMRASLGRPECSRALVYGQSAQKLPTSTTTTTTTGWLASAANATSCCSLTPLACVEFKRDKFSVAGAAKGTGAANGKGRRVSMPLSSCVRASSKCSPQEAAAALSAHTGQWSPKQRELSPSGVGQ